MPRSTIELDGRVVVPVVRPAEDARLDDPQLRLRDRSGWCAVGRSLATSARAALRRRHSLASSTRRARRARRRARSGAVSSAPSAAMRADQAPRAARGRLEAGQLAIGGADRAQRRHELALAQVEPVAGRQRVEGDAGDHDRPMPLHLVGIGVDVGRVEDGDRSLAEHLEDALRAHERRGVLVDADAEQRRGLRDERQQASESVALLEVLVDEHAGQQPEAGAHLGHPLLRRRAAGAERDHVAGDGRCAGARAGHDRAVPVALDERPAEGRAGDHARQPQLVAAGHEDRRSRRRAGQRAARRSRRRARAGACRGRRRCPSGGRARGTARSPRRPARRPSR